MTRLAGQLTQKQVTALMDHVDQRGKARGNNEPLSDSPRDGISHSACGNDQQPGLYALRQRTGVTLRPDPLSL